MTRHRALAAMIALFLVVAQVATVAAAGAGPGSASGPGQAAPIDKALQRGIDAGTATALIVEFKAKADLRAPRQVNGRTQRTAAVIKALRTTATAAQRTARSTVAKTRGVQATTYWLTNVLVVEGDAKSLDKLATQLSKVPGVTSVRAPRTYPLVKPVEVTAAIQVAAGEPEWGVAKIRADAAWADGVLGQGIVVANIDTGVDYVHPALVDHYRGNDGVGGFTHDYNWWDPSGICGPEPCDNVGHGTHTMGTMVGGDGPGPFTPDPGVAPGAEWIAAKGCEDLNCSEIALLSSGQFVLAPTDVNGENPDPSRRPDIVNNSWGGGPGDSFYLETVQAWRAAGIIPVFSSGNPGPFCGEGGSPGDFTESFSAGATDDNDVIAEFSGRGPSAFGKVNPDVAAPGVEVVSSVPGGGYQAFSGTSMAAPHVAGTLALVLSAEPTLRGDIAGATDAVRTTAIDILDDSCGGDDDGDPNNVYGDGRIDAKAAVDLVATGGTLSGTVTDDATGDPIAGAEVTANDGTRDFSTVTNASGDYELFLAAGTYLVTVDAFGYATGAAPGVVIVTDQTTDTDFALVALPRFTVTGQLTAAEDGSPIVGATVTARGHARATRRDQRQRQLQPGAADRHVPPARHGQRLHRIGRRRDHRLHRRRDRGPGLQPVPQARRLRARLCPDRFRLGRDDRPERPVRQRVRRPAAAAVRLPVLRRDLLTGLALRQRLPELRRSGPGPRVPDRDPVSVDAERGDLRALAGPPARRRQRDRL